MNEIEIRNHIEFAIKTAIASLESGTIGISADCLWQLTRINPRFAPKGTNATYYVRRMFDDIVSRKPYSAFVYRS